MNWDAWIYTFANGILLLVLGFFVKLVIDHLKKLLKEIEEYKSELQRIEQKLQGEIADRYEGAISQVYSLESRLWQEVNKLRRSVVSGNLLIRRRKAETHQILQEQKDAKGRLDAYEKFSKGASKLLKAHHGTVMRHDDDIKVIKTDVKTIGKELKIYKNGSEE